MKNFTALIKAHLAHIQLHTGHYVTAILTGVVIGAVAAILGVK